MEQLRLYTPPRSVSLGLHYRNSADNTTHRVEVGQEVKRQTCTRLELRDHTKRWQRSKLLVVLVSPLQLLLCGADA